MTLTAVLVCWLMWSTKFPKLVWLGAVVEYLLELPKIIDDAIKLYGWIFP